jgi:hypothetical protein
MMEDRRGKMGFGGTTNTTTQTIALPKTDAGACAELWGVDCGMWTVYAEGVYEHDSSWHDE